MPRSRRTPPPTLTPWRSTRNEGVGGSRYRDTTGTVRTHATSTDPPFLVETGYAVTDPATPNRRLAVRHNRVTSEPMASASVICQQNMHISQLSHRTLFRPLGRRPRVALTRPSTTAPRRFRQQIQRPEFERTVTLLPYLSIRFVCIIWTSAGRFIDANPIVSWVTRPDSTDGPAGFQSKRRGNTTE